MQISYRRLCPVRSFIFNLIDRSVNFEHSFTFCTQDILFAALMWLLGKDPIFQELIQSN
jgi:hypothetical protein